MLQSDTKEISNALSLIGPPKEPIKFEGVCTDSRKVVSGKLFIALVGENFDGHDFVDQAYENGATAALISKNVTSSIPTILVKDTDKALGLIASWYLRSIDPTVVGITGSNGKTTTKNLLSSILSINAPTLATIGNLNNHIGVPLTILALNKTHKYAVIEMGANHLNEIKYLRKIAKPSIAIVTNTSDAHIGEFGGIDNLIKAKGEIYSDDSINIVNIKTKFKGEISFGDGGDIFASDIVGKSFVLNIFNEKVSVSLQLLGKHNIENSLAASACAYALGIDLPAIKRGLESTTTEPGRLDLIHNNYITILDDTYNASPQSMLAAINTLLEFDGEKVAVIGSMAELGGESIRFHNEIGEFAKSRITNVYSFGDIAINYNSKHFNNLEELAGHIINNHLGATVLIKGSRMVGLDRLVDLLQK
ncbi:MAG TPA: UDP-N-acetylmuramoyl-tripeptide--D-alanyl-D-alanine ligase [Gammaproteobacteria bacterium]|nr:UDP-N-acetylmuramoyl-tripeptide--D-alanyl-D-alanine ligase [Gammaproteobacteria bacterium]